MIKAETVFVPLTVVMECEWVLRSFYKLTRIEISSALDRLTDVENVLFEQVDGVRWALQRLLHGADFADMVHIVQAKAAGAASFVTFDEGLEAEAGNSPPLVVERPN